MMLFAKIVSWLGSPPIIFLPAPFLLVESVAHNDIYALKWTAFSFVFIVAIFLFILLGVFLGIFSDMDVSSRKQRPLLFLFSIILLGFYCAAIIFLNGPKVLLFASLFLAFSLVILNTVNMRIKASIHVATISAFILLFSSIYGTIFLLAAVPLAFIIGWSRVKIKRHTVPEVLMGGFLGITLAIIFYIVSKLFFI